jgi:hypothetical protein
MSPRSTAKAELTLTDDDVRAEHMREVHVLAHWLYMVAVLAGGFVAMVALMVALGGTGA